MTDFYREAIDAALEAMQRKAEKADSPDDIVGHKTLMGDDGFLYHVPLTRREADQRLWGEVTPD